MPSALDAVGLLHESLRAGTVIAPRVASSAKKEASAEGNVTPCSRADYRVASDVEGNA